MVSDNDDEERQNNIVVIEETEPVVEKEENENTAIMTPSGTDDDTVPGRPAQSFQNDDSQPVLNQTKDWFLRLTPQERSSATYCVDQAFIAAFLAMAPSLSAPGPAETTGE